MTIRKAKASGKTKTDRVQRPVAGRDEPHRNGANLAATATAAPSSDAASATVAGPAPPATDPDDIRVSESVAGAVKSGYDVLAETVAQARAAANKFRQGEYNIREVPADIEVLALRLLQLARQLSTTTFDICEQLLHQVSAAGDPPPPGQVATEVPAFLATVAKTVAAAPPASPAGPGSLAPSAPAMRLTTHILGAPGATALTSSLARPQVPTAPEAITASPLAPREGAAPPLTGITFAADLSAEGLTATFTVPPGQPAGTYSGLVYASTQPLPLGMLVVELTG